jgi:hypothetical protein
VRRARAADEPSARLLRFAPRGRAFGSERKCTPAAPPAARSPLRCGTRPPRDAEPKHPARRTCRDLPFLLLFAGFWGGVIAIAALGFKQGSPQSLIYGLDYSGHTCGKNNKARAAPAAQRAPAGSSPLAEGLGDARATCACGRRPARLHRGRGCAWRGRGCGALRAGAMRCGCLIARPCADAAFCGAQKTNTTTALDLTSHKAQYWLNPNEARAATACRARRPAAPLERAP